MKCLECNKDQEVFIAKSYVFQNIRLEGNKIAEWDNVDQIGNIVSIICPNCNTEFTKDEIGVEE